MSERRYSPADFRIIPNKGESWKDFKNWILSNVDCDLIDPDIVELVKTLNQLPHFVTIWSCFGHYGTHTEIDLWCRDAKAVAKLKGAFDDFKENQVHHSLYGYPLHYSRFFIEGTDEEKRDAINKVIKRLKI
ncbi:MAG: hypothetical protein OEZ25_03200 [Candidatus Bathyarchaeota archaeon]|nr:hypothetical protein [Candidatus Bathyarchaeota archaeon]